METETCDHCGQVYTSDTGIWHKIYTKEKEVVYNFCSTICHQEDYIKRLTRGA